MGWACLLFEIVLGDTGTLIGRRFDHPFPERPWFEGLAAELSRVARWGMSMRAPDIPRLVISADFSTR